MALEPYRDPRWKELSMLQVIDVNRGIGFGDQDQVAAVVREQGGVIWMISFLGKWEQVGEREQVPEISPQKVIIAFGKLDRRSTSGSE